MFEVELRIRAVLRSQVVEFARELVLPLAPTAWLVLHDGEDTEDGSGQTLVEVSWQTQECRFICRLMDDLDAAGAFGDDLAGLCRHYQNRGWRQVAGGAVRHVDLSGLDSGRREAG